MKNMLYLVLFLLLWKNNFRRMYPRKKDGGMCREHGMYVWNFGCEVDKDNVIYIFLKIFLNYK